LSAGAPLLYQINQLIGSELALLLAVLKLGIPSLKTWLRCGAVYFNVGKSKGFRSYSFIGYLTTLFKLQLCSVPLTHEDGNMTVSVELVRILQETVEADFMLGHNIRHLSIHI
jgi:hypothetical protein